jgi:hypothetical protein
MSDLADRIEAFVAVPRHSTRRWTADGEMLTVTEARCAEANDLLREAAAALREAECHVNPWVAVNELNERLAEIAAILEPVRWPYWNDNLELRLAIGAALKIAKGDDPA